jgi:hypothetical protein
MDFCLSKQQERWVARGRLFAMCVIRALPEAELNKLLAEACGSIA